MAFPTASIGTTNLDAAADSPQSARADLLLTAQQVNDLRNWFNGTESVVAAAATVDIGAQATQRVAITSGSGAITSLGANYVGLITVRVAVACSLTYNATTLVTPFGASLSLRAGDVFFAYPKASGGAANGWMVVPAPWTGQHALNGATPSVYTTLALGRVDNSAEGGQLSLHRASDNAVAFEVDCYSTGGVDYMRILTAAGVALSVDQNGQVQIGALSPMTSPLDVNGNRLRIRTAKTPSSATDTGNQGEVCWDASYVYVCTATNTWKRSAIATW